MKRMLLAVIAAVAMILAPTTATATPVGLKVGPPTNLTITDITADSATATWDSPTKAKRVTGYRITWNADGLPAETATTTAATRTTPLKNLKPATHYTVKVAALTKHGTGKAATTTFTTKANKLPLSAYTLTGDKSSDKYALSRTPLEGGPTETIATGLPNASVFKTFPGGVIYTTETDVIRHDVKGDTVLAPLSGGVLVDADDAGNAYIARGTSLTKISPDKTSTVVIADATAPDTGSRIAFSVAPNGLVMVLQGGPGSDQVAVISVVEDGKLTNTRRFNMRAFLDYRFTALSDGGVIVGLNSKGGAWVSSTMYVAPTDAGIYFGTDLSTHQSVKSMGVAPDQSIYVGETKDLCIVVGQPQCTQDYTILTVTRFDGKNQTATYNVKGYTTMGGSSLDVAADGRMIAATSTPTPQLISYGPTGGDPTVLAPLPAGTSYATVQIN